MPILAFFNGKGINRDQYEALRREVNWEGNQPVGAILHAASFDAAGDARVVDVWESQEQLDHFVGTRLMPAMQKLKLTPPQVEVFPTHNVNAYGTVDRHKVK